MTTREILVRSKHPDAPHLCITSYVIRAESEAKLHVATGGDCVVSVFHDRLSALVTTDRDVADTDSVPLHVLTHDEWHVPFGTTAQIAESLSVSVGRIHALSTLNSGDIVHPFDYLGLFRKLLLRKHPMDAAWYHQYVPDRMASDGLWQKHNYATRFPGFVPYGTLLAVESA